MRRIINLVGGEAKHSKQGVWLFDAYRRTKLTTPNVVISTYSYAQNKRCNQYKGFFNLYHDIFRDCDGYKLGNEYTNLNDINKELTSFSKSCQHPDSMTHDLINHCDEDSIVVYITGDGRFVRSSPHQSHAHVSLQPAIGFAGENKTGNFLYHTRDSQKVLLIVDGCYGDSWIKLPNLPSNISIIGAAYTSGLYLGSKECANTRCIVGTVMQWALDRALTKKNDCGGSWINHLQYYWDNIEWFNTKHDKTLHFTNNIGDWEEEFPKFYDKNMKETPDKVVAEEQAMKGFDFCDYFGVKSWADICKPYILIHRTPEEEQLVDHIADYIVQELPGFHYHHARVAACYSVFYGKRIDIP